MPKGLKGKGKRRPAKQPMMGGNIFTDAWNGIKSAHNYVKDNKVISKGLALGGIIPGPYSAGLKTGSAVAGFLGYGATDPRAMATRYTIQS